VDGPRFNNGVFMSYLKTTVFVFAVAMLLNMILACTCRADDLKRGDLSTAISQSSLETENAKKLLNEILNQCVTDTETEN